MLRAEKELRIGYALENRLRRIARGLRLGHAVAVGSDASQVDG